MNTHPISKETWHVDSWKLTRKELMEITSTYRFGLTKRPVDSESVTLKVTYPKYRHGKRVGRLAEIQSHDLKILSEGLKKYVRFDVLPFLKTLESHGFPKSRTSVSKRYAESLSKPKN